MLLRYIATLATIGTVVSAQSCTYNSRAGATFDLSPLKKNTPYTLTYGDIPCTPTVEQNYTYYFDVCQDVPKTIPELSACPKGGAALQVNPLNPSECWTAGQLGSSFKWSLIDEATPDPSKGVKLTYANGDVCHQNNMARTTTLFFDCADNAIPNPTTAYEVSHCEYQIHLSSFYGCPLECPIAGRRLCGGQGMCAYDTYISQARCFCYEGFAGTDCTETAVASSGGNGAIIGLLVVVVIISVVLAAGLVMLLKQVRGYRQDATNYMQINGDEMTVQLDNI